MFSTFSSLEIPNPDRVVFLSLSICFYQSYFILFFYFLLAPRYCMPAARSLGGEVSAFRDRDLRRCSHV